MCTAISFDSGCHYFGRNLDYEYDFGEKIVVTPKNYIFKFFNGEIIKNHYAIIGMAVVKNNYPLYFDATNEAGLSMAGLNFPGNAVYFDHDKNKINVASFELIPWILCKCKNMSEVKELVCNLNITNDSFTPEMTPSSLHWIVSSKTESITIEQTKYGLKVFDNRVGVLTNNPPFDFHMLNLSNHLNLTANEAENTFSDKITLIPQSRGMGGIGLPGDLSSLSRFVRAAFVKLNSVCGTDEYESVNQFFHILYSVYQQRGAVKVGNSYEITNYTSCCNTEKCVYYYTTYNNFSVNAVDMYKCDLLSECLYEFELIKKQDFNIS